MLTNHPLVFVWRCDHCGYENRDEITTEFGPFFTMTCSGCGHAFDRTELDDETETGEDEA